MGLIWGEKTDLGKKRFGKVMVGLGKCGGFWENVDDYREMGDLRKYGGFWKMWWNWEKHDLGKKQTEFKENGVDFGKNKYIKENAFDLEKNKVDLGRIRWIWKNRWIWG